MVRVINYFDTQVRVPTSGGVAAAAAVAGHSSRHRAINGKDAAKTAATNTKSPFEEQMTESSARPMTDEQKVSWYSKILDSVRLRYRKLQRFARRVVFNFHACPSLMRHL